MNKRTWVILGATSMIAQEFAHKAAQTGHPLLLVARNQNQLNIIASDIRLRYQVNCDVFTADFAENISELADKLQKIPDELDLFIATSIISNNDMLDFNTITDLINVNILSTTQLIHTYWHKNQTQHRLLFLSSVAACIGRSKNSLYGASKAAIEVYLQGLQQAASPNQHITIARLGFIDTHQTYGEPGIFYASSPKACAKACWQASQANKTIIYHPYFWRWIMAAITHLPWFIYKRMGRI